MTSQESKDYLKEIFDDKLQDRTIYTFLNHCSASGMTRHISCYIARIDNKPESKSYQKAYLENITYHIGRILGNKVADDGGVVISGCGADMGFMLVYEVGGLLYPNGDGKTITGRNNSKEVETDGGYLLTQKWI